MRSGKPHYHLAIFLPSGITPPMPDKQGWWKHGSSNVKWVRNPSSYMAKYLSKWESKHCQYPKGAKTYGFSGISSYARAIAHYWSLDAWLRKITEVGDRVKKRFAGYWYNETIGYSFRSPFVLDLSTLRLQQAEISSFDVLPFDISTINDDIYLHLILNSPRKLSPVEGSHE
ncbi:MAG TPA: hypothetical protein VFT64_01215 [Rickettsiales bacterium]|nr:hypothetical protein [Rickettsiales bacterium]